MTRILPILLLLIFVVGCASDGSENEPTDPTEPMDDPIPVEPDGGIGDGAEPLPLVIARDIAPTLPGLEREEAERRLRASGASWRIVSIDNTPLAVTADFVPGRINLSVRDGRISSVEIEGN